MDHMELTYGAEVVKIYSRSDYAAIFHHRGDSCKHVTVKAGKNGQLAPVGVLFGFNEKKQTAAAEAVVKFVDGKPVIERKGLRVQAS